MSQAGSLYQRADGYWVASVTLAGKRMVKYGKTKREAQQRLSELLAASSTGTLTAPSRVTVAGWLEHWLAEQETRSRPSTLRSYRQVLLPLLPHLGDVRLDRLTPLQLSMAFTQLQREGRGSRRIQQAYVALGTCLRQAVRLGVIGSNPLDRVEKPRHVPEERPMWTLDETRRFLAAAARSSHRYTPLFVLLVTTGLRVGEALGLSWADIDLRGRALTVQRAYVYAGERGSIQPPKSKAGRRTVGLPEAAVESLQRIPRPLKPGERVFTTAKGTTPSQSNLRREFHRLCEAAGVPPIPIHGLRHVHAAVLAAEGIDPHTLRRRLGHARVSTTLDVYAYAIAPEDTAVRAFDRALDRVAGGLG